MRCVSPSCSGTVVSGACDVCSLRQAEVFGMIVVQGPLEIHRRSFGRRHATFLASSVHVEGDWFHVFALHDQQLTRTLRRHSVLALSPVTSTDWGGA